MNDARTGFAQTVLPRIVAGCFSLFLFLSFCTIALSENGADTATQQPTTWNSAALKEIILSEECYFDISEQTFQDLASRIYKDLENYYDELSSLKIPEKSEFETSTEYDAKITNMKNAVTTDAVAAMRAYLSCNEGYDYKHFKISIQDITIGTYNADDERFSEFAVPDFKVPYIRYDAAGAAWYIPYFPSYVGKCLEMPQDEDPKDEVFPPHVLRYSFANCGPTRINRDAARLMRSNPGSIRLDMVFSFRFEHRYHPRPGMFLDGLRILYDGPDQKFSIFTFAEPLPLYLPGKSQITESIYMDELHYRDKLFINNKQPGTIVRGEEKLQQQESTPDN